MNSTGGGITFSEDDVNKVKLLIGLLDRAKFELGSNQVVEAAQALVWLKRDLLKSANDNVMELRRIITPPVGSLPAESGE